MPNLQVPEITQPNWFRLGRNLGGTTIGKNRFVTTGAAQDEVVLATAASNLVEGVTTEDIPPGGHRSIQTEGRARVLSGGALALNAFVTSDAQGRAVTAATGNLVKGQVKTAATGADQLVSIELWKGLFVAP